MKTIRNSVFETNSSSSHSLTVLDHDLYNEWRDDDKLCYDFDNDKLITIDKRFKIALDHVFYTRHYRCDDPFYLEKDTIDIAAGNFDEGLPITYNEFEEGQTNDYTDINHYTSKSGDKLIILCRYSYD